ncbi:MAG TPA: hypothetical protein VJR92_13370 [Gemmatimonadaceae bacterium]|nr:hypothetical protein [Gemmatimonadaceae bacterium]
MHRVRRSLALVAALFPLGSFAQTPRSLGAPNAELKDPFTHISTIREMRDGRVLAVDERESKLMIVDFTAGTATQLGRTGNGPGEYALSGRLVALPGDTSALHDPRNVRYLIIYPDGKLGPTFRLDDSVWMKLGSRGTVPRASDSRGSLFFEGSPYTVMRGGTGIPTPYDSTPIMRYDRRSSKLDTVAWVNLDKGNVVIQPGPERGLSIRVGALAWPSRDDWVVLPDGGVAVIRASDYHIDRYGPNGGRVSGPPLRIAPLAVTEAEKNAWREDRRARAVSRTDGTIPQTIQDPTWPAVLPPFEYWQSFARPNGDIWVLRSHRAAAPSIYDVFNAAGALAARIQLPPNTRLVGFGAKSTVYLVRKDADDLQYLQRYTLQ